MTGPVAVRPIGAGDREAWAALFTEYRRFYEFPDPAAVVDQVWSWINDPTHETCGLVAVVDERVVGIAHYRRFARPAAGSTGLWLDDLFTATDARGRGVGRALIEHLRGIARDEGLTVVRWVTAQDNTQAQVLYDDLAERTTWLTYDAEPG